MERHRRLALVADLGVGSERMHDPEVFGNVLAQSGAFWRGNEGGTADLEWLTQQFKSSPKINLRFYLEAGDQETGKTPGGPIFIEANQRLHCKAIGCKVHIAFSRMGNT
jgi:enterochelin esterase-like enzyme